MPKKKRTFILYSSFSSSSSSSSSSSFQDVLYWSFFLFYLFLVGAVPWWWGDFALSHHHRDWWCRVRVCTWELSEQKKSKEKTIEKLFSLPPLNLFASVYSPDGLRWRQTLCCSRPSWLLCAMQYIYCISSSSSRSDVWHEKEKERRKSACWRRFVIHPQRIFHPASARKWLGNEKKL